MYSSTWITPHVDPSTCVVAGSGRSVPVRRAIGRSVPLSTVSIRLGQPAVSSQLEQSAGRRVRSQGKGHSFSCRANVHTRTLRMA